MPKVMIAKVLILIPVISIVFALKIYSPDVGSADNAIYRATPTPVATSTPAPTPSPISILIEENISIANQYKSGIPSGNVIEENISVANQYKSGIPSGNVIEENISVTETMNPPDEMLQELANIAEEMEVREASSEQSSRESTEEKDRRDPFGRGTGDVQSDVSDSGSCNSPNSNEGLLLFAGLLIPAFLRIRKKIS